MLVKEKRYEKNNLIFDSLHLCECDKDFIVLDDKTTKINENIRDVFKLIETYNYNLEVIDVHKYSKSIIDLIVENNIQFDTVLLVGTGGKQTFEGIKNNDIFENKNIYSVVWNRKWENDKSLGFETDLDKYDLKNKKVILIEDVIASGNTLWTLKNEIENLNGEIKGIFSILIQESSPIIDKSFCETYSVMMIKKMDDDSLDPFWYPPIYSLRHLLYGDSEMPLLYKILNEKYFNFSDEIELKIKEIR